MVIRNIKNIIAFAVMPIISILIILFLDINPEHKEATYMLAVALLMASWWILETVNLSVTALLPVVLFPLLGIMDGEEVSSQYFNDIIFLFIGGFLIAIAMQKWNFHKRIALTLLMLTGTSPARILLGFMLTTYSISMWISNTATTMMLLPIVLSVLSQLDELYGKKNTYYFSIGVLLSIAYSSSIGGIATLIGTPPNPIFLRIYQINFPQGIEVNFANWFIYAFPLSLILMIILYFLLYFLFIKNKCIEWESKIKIDFHADYKKLGNMSFEEKSVLVIFIMVAFLWLTRSPLEIGRVHIPGWSQLFSHPKYLNDGTVGIMMATILFLIPSKNKKGEFLMNWKDTIALPWGIIILFGGGFALAEGFRTSGLSESIGEILHFFKGSSLFLLIFIVTSLMIFLTEITSNSSSTVIILPILAALAIATEINPLYLMIPATLGASMAFMMPVATPPNAIVFSSQRIKISEMAKVGLILNIVVIFVISLWTYFLTPIMFNF